MSTRTLMAVVAGGLLLAGAAHPAPQAAGGLERDGRWFRYNGSPVYMIGVDMQSLMAQKPGAKDPNWDGNYTRVLNELQSAGINKVRLWANNWFIPGPDVHQPFRRLSSGKYDLDQWDGTYFSRLRDFAQRCKDRGIFIEYCLFSQYPNKPEDRFRSTSSFWHRDRNVNGAFADTDGGNGFYAEMFKNAPGQLTSSGRDLNYYQRRLVDKVGNEVGGLGNLYFQVLNEPRDGGSGTSWGSDIWPWTRSMARYIHDTKGYLSSVEVRAGDPANLSILSQYAGRSYVDIMGNHTYNGDPTLIGRELSPFQRTGQILQCSESFSFRTHLDTVTREAWAWAVSGGHYAFYIPDKEFSMIGDSQWDVVARRSRALRQVMESVNFRQMSPVDASGNEYDSLISAGPSGGNRQLLANPGSEYIAYFWGSKSTTAVRISLPAGTYDYEWFDTRNGNRLSGGNVTGGGTTTISSPGTGWVAASGVVLVVRSSAAVPPPDRDPVVSFTVPAAGSTVSGTVAINATANDPDAGANDGDGIQNVVFQLRRSGNVVASHQENVVTYDWNLDTTAYADGIYTLRAIATSTAGAGGTSSRADITITIANLSSGGNLPSPWQHLDIGNVAVTGSASYTGGTFTVNGSGADIWNAADAFHFVYQPLAGDGSVLARATGLGNTHAWAKAVVMIRETLAADSVHAMTIVTPVNGTWFQWRPQTGASSAGAAGPTTAVPTWVRVTRSGNAFEGWTSPDGLTWTSVGTVTIGMGSDAFAGFGVTSHDNTVVNTGTFESVMVVKGADADGDGMSDGDEATAGFDGANGDQDANGIPDGLDDWDGDGIDNHTELANGTSPGSAPGASAGGSGTGSKGGSCGATGAEVLLLLGLLSLRRRTGGAGPSGG